ncbi:MAG: hypothetical protein VKO64_01890 [Candidatus Sericytochromatia bacterium]|nr:hypothetical protein [Candidatus Sericytochromatia bacterium]
MPYRSSQVRQFLRAVILLALVACQGGTGQTLARSPVLGGLLPIGTIATPTGSESTRESARRGFLAGEVRVPPSFAAVLGGTLVANNAAGLVGNHAGGLATAPNPRRRTQTGSLAQQPLAGVRVALVDVRGNPVLDTDGSAVTARTDATGRYTLARPAENRPARLLVGEDQSTAFARLVAADLNSVSSISADVDISTTLVARYCLDQYLSDQPAPEAALARMPASIEADAVARTQAVIADTADLLADKSRLDSRTVVEAVWRLQARHETVKTGFETLRKLLVVAGLSNLGDGEPATRVALSDVRDMLTAPDGGLYLNCPDDKRIWWLRVDGTLRALVGRVASGDTRVEPEIGMVAKMSAKADGSLILLEEDRKPNDTPLLWRLSPSGTLEAIEHGIVGLEAALPLDGKRLLLISTALDQMATFWELDPGTAPRRLSALSLAADWSLPDYPPAITQAALLPDGRVRLATSLWMSGRVLDVDPDTGAMQRWFDGQPYGLPGPLLTPDGRVVMFDGHNSFRVLSYPEATASAQATPRRFIGNWDPLLVDGEGRLVIAQTRKVERLENGIWSVVAGLDAQQTPDTSAGVREPRSFSILPDGRLVIVDGDDLVLQVPGKSAMPLVPAGSLDPAATESAGYVPKAVVVDPADGRIFVHARDGQDTLGPQHRERIYRVGLDGKAVLQLETERDIWNMAVGPQGDLFVSEYTFLGPKRILAINREGISREVLGDDAPYFGLSRIGFDQDGTMHVENVSYGSGPEYKRTSQVLPVRDGVVQPALPEDAIFPEAVDARGWFYEGLGLNEGGLPGWKGSLVRRHRTTGITEILAGPGGRFFSGTGVDDGVSGARDPVFGPDGALYFLDMGNRQIKRIPAEALAGEIPQDR